MPTILVVDDDPAIRALFSRALKPLGDVEQAMNGTEAMSLLSTKRYDVIVLDWHMPGIDGPGVLAALEDRTTMNAGTPVIVVTADHSDRARTTALEGAVYFIQKPVQLASLSLLVRTTIERGRRR